MNHGGGPMRGGGAHFAQALVNQTPAYCACKKRRKKRKKKK